MSQSVSDNYLAASKDITVTINKAAPVISITNPGPKTFGDPEFNLVATSSHNESSLTYASSSDSVATIGINNGRVKILNVRTGTVTFTVSQSVSDNYLAASKDITVTLNKATSIINVVDPPIKTFGDPDFNVNASSSHNESALIYSSMNTNRASINDLGEVRIVGAGTVIIKVFQEVSDNYLSGEQLITLKINQATPVINIVDPGSKTFGDPDFDLVATSHTETMLTYVSSNVQRAYFKNLQRVSIVGAGSVIFTVSQPASTNYLAGSNQISVTINKANSVISVVTPIIKTFGDPSFNVNATSTNNESELMYSSSNNDIATISSSGNVNIVGTAPSIFPPEINI